MGCTCGKKKKKGLATQIGKDNNMRPKHSQPEDTPLAHLFLAEQENCMGGHKQTRTAPVYVCLMRSRWLCHKKSTGMTDRQIDR